MASEESNMNEDSSSGAENIQVVVRIRPPGDEPNNARVVNVDPSRKQVILQQSPTPRIFSFDHIVDIDDSQESIFAKIGKKVIENCIAGYNGTIFAYGQTGSGKTYTMLGPTEDAETFRHEQRGVIPRSFEYLYNLIKREKEVHGEKKQFLCKCSFLEIYNEQIFDLLEPSNTALQLREGLKTGVYVSGLSEKVVSDATEAYEALTSSWMNRRVAATSMNRESSRSHAVFTLQIESKEKKGAIEHIRTSQLNLVDLAGSERQKDTCTSGIRLKEAGSINKSLSNLGNVIMSLVSASREGPGSKRFVPYRDSKLTFLLRDSLGGNSRTKLIACVHPGQRCFGETLSTLQFAKRAKMIKNKAVLNEDTCRNVEQLQAEIRNLKEMLRQVEARGLVTQPSTATPEDAGDAAGDSSVLKEMFIKAMFLQQKTETKKNELNAEVKKWREVCDKKDKSMQTSKMIIKFRENNISRLEQKMKEQEAPDTRVVDLQDENVQLRSLVERHPDVAQLNIEVHKLRAILRDLRGEAGTMATVGEDRQRVQQLMDKYQELLAEEAVAQGEGEKYLTPKRQDSVSSAALEKLKSCVSELEEEKEELKKQLADARQEADVKFMKLSSELESKKTHVTELEMVLAANTTKSRLEIQALNEKHLQTVKTITTPKKETYHLRNRVVVANSETPELDITIPFEEPVEQVNLFEAEDDILSSFKAAEALQEDIKQLHDEKSELKSRLDEYESDRVKASSQVDLLTKQIQNLEEMLQKERDNHQQELVKKEELSRKTLEEKNNAEETVKDLNVLWFHCDKELKVTKEKSRSRETEVENLKDKNAELSADLEANIKQKEKFEERIRALEEELDNEMCTTMFREDQIQELEARLQKSEALVSQQREEILQNLAVKPEREARIGELERELKERDASLQELQRVGSEREAILIKERNETGEMIKALNQQRDALKADKVELESHALDLQEKLQHYEGSNQELEATLNAKKEEIEELILEKMRAKAKEDNYEEDIASLTDENERLINQQLELEETNCNLEKEHKCLKESVETMVNMSEHNKLVYQLEGLETMGRQKTEEIERLMHQLAEADKEKSGMQKMLEDVQHKNQQAVESLREEIAQQRSTLTSINEENQKILSSYNLMRLDFDFSIKESTITEEENKRLKDTSLKDKEKIAEYSTVLQKLQDLYNDGELSSHEDLVEMIKLTKEEKDHLDNEFSGIVGHANHKQKIRLHTKLKADRDYYKKEFGNLQQKYNMQHERVKELENREKHGFLKNRMAGEHSLLKENKPPSHKTFLSGDFSSTT